MNTKELVRGVVVAMLLMTAWYGGVFWAKKHHPEWFVTQVPVTPEQPATAPAGVPTTSVTSTTGPSTLPGIESTATAPASGLRAEVTGESLDSVALGAGAKKDASYAMQITLDRKGGGIEQVLLNDFDVAVKDKSSFVFQQPSSGHEATTRSLATRSIAINGTSVDLSNVDWNLKKDGDAAFATMDIVGPAGPVARLIKTYRITSRNSQTQGFEIGYDYRVENLTEAPLKVKLEMNGPVVPPQELQQGDRQVLSGQKDGPKITPHQHLAQTFSKKTPSMELLTDDENRPAYWAGGASAYFNAILLPLSTTDPRQPADYLESIKAEGLDIQDESSDPLKRKIAITFRTKELEIKPKEALTLPMTAYFGPRKRQVLGSDYYAMLPRGYYSTLVISSGFCSICTFDWLINGLVKLLSFFHFILKDWGLAIICLVVLVRSLLHPITKKSQINMLKMGKMGPEIEKLKKKHGDNKDELNKAMMQFYKTQGATPILGCLPMFLQMPIWIALYSALQSTFELRQAPFLYGLTWIDDLSKPDGLLTWQPVSLIFGWHISGLNILPLLLGVVFWLNQKYTPKPPATTPEQAQQQKMMQWMTLLFPMFLYTGPSGLNLYILTSTAIGIIESKVIRDHIKQREELEKLNGPVIIDVPATRGARRREKDEPAAVVKKGGLMGWFTSMQEKAEQIRKEAERGNRKS